MKMIVGSQESVGDKYIDNICTKFCLNFELKATGIFVILRCQDAIRKQRPKQSLHNFSSEAAIQRCSSKQVFLKVH